MGLSTYAEELIKTLPLGAACSFVGGYRMAIDGVEKMILTSADIYFIQSLLKEKLSLHDLSHAENRSIDQLDSKLALLLKLTTENERQPK